jgi:hypothetical protein
MMMMCTRRYDGKESECLQCLHELGSCSRVIDVVERLDMVEREPEREEE